jgi:hypothetical protein
MSDWSVVNFISGVLSATGLCVEGYLLRRATGSIAISFVLAHEDPTLWHVCTAQCKVRKLPLLFVQFSDLNPSNGVGSNYQTVSTFRSCLKAVEFPTKIEEVMQCFLEDFKHSSLCQSFRVPFSILYHVSCNFFFNISPNAKFHR